MLSYDDSVKCPDPELVLFRKSIERNFPDNCLIYLHEATHIVYQRELGHDPQVRGPHYMFLDGKWQEAIGSVEGLPETIAMKADPVLVAKWLLGPMFVELQLWPEEKRWIEATATGDVYIFNSWCARRYPEIAAAPRELTDEARVAVLRDLQQESFREFLFGAVCKYEEEEYSAPIDRTPK